MSELLAKRAASAQTRDSLFLVFRIGSERYALEAVEIAEVLPCLQLKGIAHAPAWVAGVFAHRGAMVPVIDVSAMTFGQPAVARTSTRLVLVHYRPGPDAADYRLGLILEQATDTLRCNPQDFQPYGLDNRQAPYLGPVLEDAQGLVQRIRLKDLLSPEIRALLFPDAAEAP
ncbi:chemotaxis protein CheW [Pseudomonas vanderleydeniana]|uniref:Chemotaxis protein CheW n=1 Tax=Pseudomonas vanderleydeniana TaxID=2745495 RepID=A0A9E6PNQ2_9PSED|nr:chemotaxis protein CheW [Pseudomonas vanderleydeniana]QXI29642.1 chemotaxis protein CheW [Pseudomonas vanderleydeniana]